MSYRDTLPAGSLISNEYQIQRVLGTGGFANTYLAQDLALRRLVAIKEYFPRQAAFRSDGVTVSAKSSQLQKDYLWGLKRFTREAKIIARFKHPNIVRIFRVLDAHNTAYIVLEYVDGADLEALMKQRNSQLSQRDVDLLLPGLLNALALVHREGVLHRDIKPANIYIRAADGIPVLLDFGASKFELGEMTGTTLAIVSRGYSPQEAYATDARSQGPWTDIYGLAATFYFMLTQHAPQEATERVLGDAMVPAQQLPLKGYRESFLAAIDWGLRVQPSHRPQSVAEWLPALLHGAAVPRPIPVGAATPVRSRSAPKAACPQPRPAPVASQAERVRSMPVPQLAPPSGQSNPHMSHQQVASQKLTTAVALLPAKPVSQPHTSRQSIAPIAHASTSMPSSRRLPHRPQRSPASLAKIVVGLVAVAVIGMASWWWAPYLSSASTALSNLWSPTPEVGRPRPNSGPSYVPPRRNYEPPSREIGRPAERESEPAVPSPHNASSTRSRNTSDNEGQSSGSGYSRPSNRAPSANSSDRESYRPAPVAIPQ